MKINILTFTLLFSVNFMLAQQPTPAPKQSKIICIKGAKIHTAIGEPIANGMLIFKDGKITYVGTENATELANANELIDCKGNEIYPGFIATNSTLGLTEIEAVRATNDFNEVGQNNANTRSIIAYYTDSKVIPTVRTNGVLMAQVTPRGGLFSGTSSIVQLDAWNWEDAAIGYDDGLHLNWPNMSAPSFYNEDGKGPNEKNKNYEKVIQTIVKFFDDAKAYSLSKPTEINLRLEAAKPILLGNKNLYIHANQSREIIDAVGIAKQYGISKIVIVGGDDSHLITDFLKQNNVSVMLQRVHSLPKNNDADVDLPYKKATILQNAGMLFCLQNEGEMEAMNTRNLPFLAGTTVAYGLSYNDAVKSLTINAAKIIGIDKTCGSLEIGKDATFFVSTGDALDMKTNNVLFAFIQGRKLELTNVQNELNNKYKAKYKLK